MRTARSSVSALLFLAAVCSSAQNGSATLPELPKDPQAILALAEQHYQLNSAAMKPWYFRVSYQLYDRTGQPTEKGTVDDWWASPRVYRETWIQGGNTLSVWHTADGKRLTVASGDEIRYFEAMIPSDLLEPLPQKLAENLKGSELKRDMISFGNTRVPCVRSFNLGQVDSTYCFDPHLLMLLLKVDASGIEFRYGDFVKAGGRDFPRSMIESVNGQKLLMARVETIGDLSADDPALDVPADARTDGLAYPHGHGVLGKPTGPALQYPFEAREERLQGAVVFEAKIDKDGRVQDLELIAGPDPILEDAARKTASQWRFEPYQENGQAVPVRAQVELIFRLHRR
ncbi:MAG TPA: energy transducer TonB [Acidobacteriaceae bacterium]|jgi:TonB family protein|nr:energy transducer TonB [Acidobacteriaceae bacterium]